MSRSLFICYTPLHAIIAKRIIEKENISTYSVLFFCSTENSKHRHYYDLISDGATYSQFAVITKNIVKDYLFIRSFIKRIHTIGFDHDTVLYTGNIKIIYSRIAMYLSKMTKFITFDDGSGNISGSGYFYINDTLLKSLVFKIAAPRLQYSVLRHSMLKHYSLFRLPNVYSNIQHIEMFTPLVGVHREGSLRILLTSPFGEDGEMDEMDEKTLYQKIVRKYKINRILPHPRENQQKITGVGIEYIDTELIAEDYLNRMSRDHFITVYGLYSTALLTLHIDNNIKVVNIDVQLKKPTTRLRSTFLQLGIATDPAPLLPDSSSQT